MDKEEDTKYNLKSIIPALIIGFLAGYFIAGGTFKNEIKIQTNNMHEAMGGMTNGLNGKIGDDLDKAFIEEMIIHHQGAIDMAKTLISGTKRPELMKLGNDIIKAQSTEIEMMKNWKNNWFGY